MKRFAIMLAMGWAVGGTGGPVAMAGQEIKVGQPLRDPAITFDAEKRVYYLTGTVGTPGKNGDVDFDRNRGIFLWKSADLATWQEVGWAWEFTRQGKQLGWPFQLEVALPGAKGLGHGLRAAELHHLGGKWLLCFSKNGMNAGLMAAASPEKPFALMDGFYWPQDQIKGSDSRFGRNSPYSSMIPGDPSLFQEDDGPVYFIWGGGAIVKLKPDLTGWAEQPRHLQAASSGWPATVTNAELLHEEGASLFKNGNAYYLTFAAWSARAGQGHYDTWVCKANALFGPYSTPALLIPDAGQIKLFTAAAGPRAACMQNGKPMIVEVKLP